MFVVLSTVSSVVGLLFAGGKGGSSGGLADLIPGHQEAALRQRVEADSFPTAAQALHTPPGGAADISDRTRDGS